MANFNYVVLDCETGGLDPKKNPITQIGLLILDKELKEVNRWETYVKPYNDLVIEDQALEATGLKMSDIRAGISKEELLAHLIKIFKSLNTTNKGKWHALGHPVIVGHNIGFDIDMLDYLFKDGKCNLFDYIYNNHIDTQSLFKIIEPNFSSYKLGVCCQHFGIELNDAHKAMADVIATTSLFKKITKRLKASVGSEAVDVEEQVKKSRLKFQF